MRVLVVEDESRIASFVAKGLAANGYLVDRAATGAAALDAVADQIPDLVVLDLGLPDMDGLEVLRRLRAEGSEPPVIVLTARGTVDERVRGLDVGADDYLAKPFAFEELLARVRARLRTGASGHPPTELRAGDLVVDLLGRDVRIGERSVTLTARQFSLLEQFLRHPDRVLTRQELLSSVWEMEFDPGTNLVDVYVGYLRRKLGSDVIQTVRGAGYRLGTPPAATPTPA
jgi:DNA-binding response OmpR family regulator